MYFVMFCHLLFFSFCRWRNLTGGTWVKEVMTIPSVVPPSMENKPPSGDVTEEVGQPVKDVQPILLSVPSAT